MWCHILHIQKNLWGVGFAEGQPAMALLMCRAEVARRGPVCRAGTKCPGATLCTSGRDSVTSLCQCLGQRQLLMDRELQGQTQSEEPSG